MNILRIDSSSNGEQSVTRQLGNQLMERLCVKHPESTVVQRDINQGMSFIDAEWVNASYTPEVERTSAQRDALQQSDQLIDELDAADIVVLTVPLYNFSVPAAMKAWIDLICQAQKTFAYTEKGPVGLLQDRPVYLVMSSGGVAFGSGEDFASGYMKQVLSFVGLNDVRIIDAECIAIDADVAHARAKTQINHYLPMN